MTRLSKALALACGVAALALATVGAAAAQQGGRWVRERIYEGRDRATAQMFAGEINRGDRFGLRNAQVVPDGGPDRWAVDAERYYPADPRPPAAPRTLTGHLAAPQPNARGVVRHTVPGLTPGA